MQFLKKVCGFIKKYSFIIISALVGVIVLLLRGGSNKRGMEEAERACRDLRDDLDRERRELEQREGALRERESRLTEQDKLAREREEANRAREEQHQQGKEITERELERHREREAESSRTEELNRTERKALDGIDDIIKNVEERTKSRES